jgi:NADH-quinone oxidoreductase subunit L
MISAENNFFSDSIFVATQNQDLLNEIHHTPTLVKLSPMLLSIVAIVLAYWFYVKNTNLSVKLAKNFSWLYNFDDLL